MYDIEETELMDESDEKEHFRGFLLQINRFCNTREETQHFFHRSTQDLITIYQLW